MAQENDTESRTLALSGLGVGGFKSIRDSGDVELRQLTILAGANSTGKSSLMQPLLLLKQTMDAPFDAGPLKLDGPNVRFDRFEEALWKQAVPRSRQGFHLKLMTPDGDFVEEAFRRGEGNKIDIESCRSLLGGNPIVLRPGMPPDELRAAFQKSSSQKLGPAVRFEVKRWKCWLVPSVAMPQEMSAPRVFDDLLGTYSRLFVEQANTAIARLIHLAGLRGNPSRTYPVTAVGPTFPGTFAEYAASIIAGWKNTRDGKLAALGEAMAHLGLTWKISAEEIQDTQVRILVGRMLRARRGGARDLVNIADVGFGVSQSLPVAVALIAAEAGQLVYIEQPEMHLHPRAQVAMAKLIADATKRGVQLVIETHSDLMLMGIQTLVANGEFDPSLVKLHWFDRDRKTGETKITPADLDENGAFGDWPEDFGKVALETERAYLDATHG